MTPEQLDTYTQVYFLDRSSRSPVPEAVRPLLARETIQPTTLLTVQFEAEIDKGGVRLLPRLLESHAALKLFRLKVRSASSSRVIVDAGVGGARKR